MRKVNKNFKIRPLSLRGSRGAYQRAVAAVIARPGWFRGASLIYKGNPVLRQLHSIYDGKCAYCEQIPIGSPVQVDHFRPKDGVNGSTHTGYYWLAYEWSNLLLCCGNCNSSKGNHFPIYSAVRALPPILVVNNGVLDDSENFIGNNTLRPESFVLINPEIDNPAEHLVYSPTGEMLFISNRGDISIQRYDLNRDELYVDGRKKIIENILLKFGRRLDRYTLGNISLVSVREQLMDVIFEEIWNPIAQKRSFTTFYKLLLSDYERYFVSTIGNIKAKIALRLAFVKFIETL